MPLVLLWARRRRAADGLLLLAFLLFLRLPADWNNVYYVLPCVLALVAFDASRGRAPLAAAVVTGATWFTVVELSSMVSPDAQSAAYLAWAVPFAAVFALRLYAPQRWARLRAAARVAVPHEALPVTRRIVSSFGVRAEDLPAVVGHDDQVLDAHAEAPGQVDAGLDGDDLAGGELARLVLARRGSSWTSRPTPWPRPCPKRSPCPPPMMARAAASASRPLTPARVASRPASCASSTSS